MASIQDSTTTVLNTAGTSINVNMPATVEADQELIAVLCWMDTNSPSSFSMTGFTVEVQRLVGGAPICIVYRKKADGTEGGTTVTCSWTNNAECAAVALSVANWNGTETTGIDSVAFVDNGLTATPDPPSISPSWGAEADTLFLICGASLDDAETVSSPSTNYTTEQTVGASGAPANSQPSAHVMYRITSSATEDPGTYTLTDSEAVITTVVAIRDGASGPLAGASVPGIEVIRNIPGVAF